MQADFSAISSTDDYTEIEECAKFFVDAFWLRGTTLGRLELPPPQRAELEREQALDMKGRYGRLVGRRRLESRLLLARDEAGAIEGCAGIEVAVADAADCTVLSRFRFTVHCSLPRSRLLLLP